MGFSNKKEMKQVTGSTIIGKGADIIGELTVNDQLHIDGHVNGKVESSEQVTVGLSGEIIGEVVAKRLIVSGKVRAKVTADIVEISNKGDLDGEIICKSLIINDGGLFQGDCRRLGEKQGETAVKVTPARKIDPMANPAKA